MAPARHWDPAEVQAGLRRLENSREHGWADLSAKAQAEPHRAAQADLELAWLDLLTPLVATRFASGDAFEAAARQAAVDPPVGEPPYDLERYRRFKLKAGEDLIADMLSRA